MDSLSLLSTLPYQFQPFLINESIFMSAQKNIYIIDPETFSNQTSEKSFIWRTNHISQQIQQNILVINNREKCLKWDLMCLGISKVSKFLIWWNDRVLIGEERESRRRNNRIKWNHFKINNRFMRLSMFPRLRCYFYCFWHFHWIFLLCG